MLAKRNLIDFTAVWRHNVRIETTFTMSFNIQNVVVGGQEPFFLLGPCSLENEAFETLNTVVIRKY